MMDSKTPQTTHPLSSNDRTTTLTIDAMSVMGMKER